MLSRATSPLGGGCGVTASAWRFASACICFHHVPCRVPRPYSASVRSSTACGTGTANTPDGGPSRAASGAGNSG